MNWLGLTNSSKAINPTGDMIPSEPNTDVIAEVVTVLGDEIVGIPSVLLGELLHDLLHILRARLCPSNQDPFPECEPLALLRHPLEDPSRGVLVSPKCILHSMNCTIGHLNKSIQT